MLIYIYMNMNHQRLISGALHDGILTQMDIEPARRTTRSRDKLLSIIYCNHIHVPLFQDSFNAKVIHHFRVYIRKQSLVSSAASGRSGRACSTVASHTPQTGRWRPLLKRPRELGRGCEPKARGHGELGMDQTASELLHGDIPTFVGWCHIWCSEFHGLLDPTTFCNYWFLLKIWKSEYNITEWHWSQEIHGTLLKSNMAMEHKQFICINN
jgi:hypothetical protein